MFEKIFCNLAKNMKTKKSLITRFIGNTTLLKNFVFLKIVIVTNEKYIDCLNLANWLISFVKKNIFLKNSKWPKSSIFFGSKTAE
jgi:hypothetical protein